jgi:hypothetical protein
MIEARQLSALIITMMRMVRRYEVMLESFSKLLRKSASLIFASRVRKTSLNYPL